MNLLVMGGLISLSINLSLGIFVLLNNSHRTLNRRFAIVNFCIGVWSLGSFLINTIANKEFSIWILRACYLFAIILAPAFLSFIYAVLNKDIDKKTMSLFIFFAGLFIISLPTNLFIRGLDIISGTEFLISSPGPIYYCFVIGFGVGGYICFSMLFNGVKSSYGVMRNQLKYVLVAYFIAFIAAIDYFVSVLKIVNMFPIDDYILVIPFSILAYAIVNYQLMDITFAVRDTTVRLASSFIPAAVFIVLSLLFFSRPVIIVALILTAITSPLLYGPLRRLLLPVILGGKYGYQQKLRRISDKWFSIFSLDRLSEALVRDVANTIGINCCNFMIYDQDDKSYFVKAKTGFKEGKEGEEIEEVFFKEEGPLVSYLKKEKTIAIKEVLKIQPPFSEHDPVVKEMDKVKAAISVPLYIDDELKAILNLGDKASGEMYNRQDLEILSQIAKDAEVMFRYSFFNYEQSLLVYRYSHDLRTPLDPVQTYLYLMQQGKLNEEEIQKYLKIVRKNIDFVAQGLSDMYQLSQMAYDHIRKKFVFGHFDITEMTKRIVEDFTSEAKKKNLYLTYNRKKQIPLAYGHQQGIERLIRNLIQNGIKFTDKGSVEVNISSEKEDIRIKVSDTGPGIPRKDLPKIFNPFFKTKGRDQIVEGSGLGLTIVREITALHGGEINVESEVGKGTTFTVLLPAFKKRKI